MYEALLLSATDVAALRAALKTPAFSALTSLVPGLTLALQHPQLDVDLGDLYNCSDAIREVRSNTNHPEDWDDIDEVLCAGTKRRRIFNEAATVFENKKATAVHVLAVTETEQSEASSAVDAPTEYFSIVLERVGSTDPFELDETLYEDFGQAWVALKAYAENRVGGYGAEYAIVSFDELKANPKKYAEMEVLATSYNEDTKSAYITESYGGRSVRNCYFLQKFTKINATRVSNA